MKDGCSMVAKGGMRRTCEPRRSWMLVAVALVVVVLIAVPFAAVATNDVSIDAASGVAVDKDAIEIPGGASNAQLWVASISTLASALDDAAGSDENQLASYAVTLSCKEDDSTKILTSSFGRISLTFTVDSDIKQVKVYYLKEDGSKADSGWLDVSGGEATFALEEYGYSGPVANLVLVQKADSAELTAAKQSAKTKLQNAYQGLSESDYSSNNWMMIGVYYNAGLKRIEAASDVDTVNTMLNASLQLMSGVATLKPKSSSGSSTLEHVLLGADSKTLKVGESYTVSVSFEPSDASGTSLMWTSSDTGIAKVSSSGKITGTGPGTATITATATNGVKDTMKVTVRKADGNSTYTDPSSNTSRGSSSFVASKSGETSTSGSDDGDDDSSNTSQSTSSGSDANQDPSILGIDSDDSGQTQGASDNTGYESENGITDFIVQNPMQSVGGSAVLGALAVALVVGLVALARRRHAKNEALLDAMAAAEIESAVAVREAGSSKRDQIGRQVQSVDLGESGTMKVTITS